MTRATSSADVEARIAALEAQLKAAQSRQEAAEKARDLALARIKSLEGSYERLKEHYELLKRQLYVAKAERVDHRQLQLEFEAVRKELEKAAEELGLDVPGDDEREPPPRQKRKPKGRRNLADADLPVERVELLHPELDGKYERIGWETSYQLGYVRGGARKIEIARAKYKLPGDGDATEIPLCQGSCRPG